jgi:hypothetical protein
MIKNLDWKRSAIYSIMIYQTNSNYEKVIEPNKTFSNEMKESGVSLALSNFDIGFEGKFIIELQVFCDLFHTI